MKRHDKYFVYIIEDKNGMYYTGYTQDVQKRLVMHEKGDGAKCLVGKKPLKLVFVKEYQYYKSALNAERKIKGYIQERKRELVKIYENNK